MTTEAENANSTYDVIVIGGGPAGLSTALYTTRLGHDTAIIDRGGGRAAMMLDTHNVIGVTEDISGNAFLKTAVNQIEAYGANYIRGYITDLTPQESDSGFILTGTEETYTAQRVVLATGFTDNRPDPPLPRTGRGLHYCLHCDAYMFIDEPVYVMGHSDAAAHVAMIMLNFTDTVDLLLRDTQPTWNETTDLLLDAHPINIIEPDIETVENDDSGWLAGFTFEDGTRRSYKGGFAMYGSDYNNDLARGVGTTINDDGTIAVDEDGRTSVDGLFAVGDLTPGNNQIPIAMGEGAKAGIAIHKELRAFPRSIEDIETEDISQEAVPAVSHRLRERAHAYTDESQSVETD